MLTGFSVETPLRSQFSVETPLQRQFSASEVALEWGLDVRG
jgi:hypothetical protein